MAQETKPQRNARLLNAVKNHPVSSAVAWNLVRELPASCLKVAVGGSVTVRPVRDDLMDTMKHTDAYWLFFQSTYTDSVFIEVVDDVEEYHRSAIDEWSNVVKRAKAFKPLTEAQIEATKFGLIEVLDDMTFSDQKVFARMKLNVVMGITDTMTVEEFQEHVWQTRTPNHWVLWLNVNPLTHARGEEE